MDRDRISGVVLAGGRSTRFGRDKLAARVGAGTLLDRAIAGLSPLCTDVTVVIGTGAGEPALAESAAVPVRFVRDPEPDRGPVLGLATGLEAAPNPVVVVVGGDMPTLVPAVLELLAAEIAAGATAAALEDGGGLRPLPAAFDRSAGLAAARAMLREEPRKSRLRAVLAALDAIAVPERVWREHDPGGATLRDVDRPEDLARLA
jgi:molybdopterin-guanine dinucleotide biosynthesis protein A